MFDLYNRRQFVVAVINCLESLCTTINLIRPCIDTTFDDERRPNTNYSNISVYNYLLISISTDFLKKKK